MANEYQKRHYIDPIPEVGDNLCFICGKEAEDPTPHPDPYDLEVEGDNTPVVLCNSCYEFREDEI